MSLGWSVSCHYALRNSTVLDQSAPDGRSDSQLRSGPVNGIYAMENIISHSRFALSNRRRSLRLYGTGIPAR